MTTTNQPAGQPAAPSNAPSAAEDAAVRDWERWAAQRETRLARPHGTLALTGTHWLDVEPAPIVEGEPVLWSSSPDGMTITLTAKAEHGLVFEGEPVDGTVTLYPDSAPKPSVLTAGELRLELIERDGVAALRVYDPAAPTRTGFKGIDRYPYNPAVAPAANGPARFTPYPQQRAESVLNADGKHRDLSLVGEVEFTVLGHSHRFAVERNDDGSLQAVFADADSGTETYRFRFLRIPAPDAEGRTEVDFNRAYLPPCAFVDHYVCPVPPRGNTLPLAVKAGERFPKA